MKLTKAIEKSVLERMDTTSKANYNYNEIVNTELVYVESFKEKLNTINGILLFLLLSDTEQPVRKNITIVMLMRIY